MAATEHDTNEDLIWDLYPEMSFLLDIRCEGICWLCENDSHELCQETHHIACQCFKDDHQEVW